MKNKHDYENSKYKLFSIGIVAEDKEVHSDTIKVYPLEVLPYTDGLINTDLVVINKEGVDVNGVPYKSSISISEYIEAQWKKSTNRRTSPNVVSGEQVNLYTLGNSNRFFWESIGRDDNLRREEKIVFAIASSKDKSRSENLGFSDSHYYVLACDSINKKIILTTSEDDGEYCKYFIELNTKEGYFRVQDSVGQVIKMDSRNETITLKNNYNTYATLEKEDIRFHAPGNMEIKVGKNVTWDVGGDVTTNVGGKVSTDIAASYSLVAGSSVSFKSGSATSIAAGGSFSVKSSGSDIDSGGSSSMGAVSIKSLNVTKALGLFIGKFKKK